MQEFGAPGWATPSRSARRAASRPPLDEPRVLLVEDDLEYARMVQRVMLRGHPPLRVHREDRLSAALRRLERDHFDAVVLDLTLPDAAGHATLDSVCAMARQRAVVVLTGTDDEHLALEAIRVGAQDYLVKQRTHALSLPGAVTRAIERQRRGDAGVRVPRSGLRTSPPELVGEAELLHHLGCALARARRRREPLAVMVAGYADPGWLASQLGATGAERILSRAAERIARCVRRGDLLAQLDASRLAVVLEGRGNRPQWEQVARGFRAVLECLAPEARAGLEVGSLRARIGISVHPEEGGDARILLANAISAWEAGPPHGGVRFHRVDG